MNAKAVERIPFDYFAQPCGAQAEIVILLVIDGCPEVYNIVDVGIEGEGKSIAFAEDEFFVTGTGVEIQGCSAVAYALAHAKRQGSDHIARLSLHCVEGCHHISGFGGEASAHACCVKAACEWPFTVRRGADAHIETEFVGRKPAGFQTPLVDRKHIPDRGDEREMDIKVIFVHFECSPRQHIFSGRYFEGVETVGEIREIQPVDVIRTECVLIQQPRFGR